MDLQGIRQVTFRITGFRFRLRTLGAYKDFRCLYKFSIYMYVYV